MSLLGRAKKLIRKSEPYDEWQYWNSRPDPNSKSGWEPKSLNATLAFISRHAKNCNPVFELGPGVGRTLDAYEKGRKVCGYDISGLYKETLRARAEARGILLELTIANNILECFPYPDKSFGVGVACQVFLHQRPEHIRHVMAEAARICQKVIVITGGYQANNARHVFCHDYPTLCAQIGCEMHYVRAEPPQLFFVYTDG